MEFHRRRGHAAGAHRAAVDMNGACAALTDAAAEFRAGQPDLIADHPQERRLWIRIDAMSCAVDDQFEGHAVNFSELRRL